MQKIIKSLTLSLLFTIIVRGDILPDPTKYHLYDRAVYIDNLNDFKDYKFVVLLDSVMCAYPQIIDINYSSGLIPQIWKGAVEYVFAIDKSLYENSDKNVLAEELSDFREKENYLPLPLTTQKGLFMENRYPVSAEDYHYKITNIKDKNATLKLKYRDIKFLDGTEDRQEIK